MATKARKLSGWVIALIVVGVLALIAAVAWAVSSTVALADDTKIDTWAEGLGQLGVVGEGLDAASKFWEFIRGKLGGANA